jgi:F-type H+-transporting ATPase subunit epsilon
MPELHLRIVTPDRVLHDCKVRSVSFMGVDGSYGILPRHAPLITATQPGIAQITHEDGRVEKLFLSDGFAEVRDNTLTFVCEAGESAREIDYARAKAAEERARKELAEAAPEGDVLREEAEAALRRAVLRQMLAGRGGGGGPESIGSGD